MIYNIYIYVCIYIYIYIYMYTYTYIINFFFLIDHRSIYSNTAVQTKASTLRNPHRAHSAAASAPCKR